MGKGRPGCLAGLLSLLGRGQGDSGELPYRLRDDFLSPAELSFFRVLEEAVGARYAVCPKVALRDLVFVAQPQRNMAYINKVQGKHVDFVLCEPGTMRPVVAVELDDSSHSLADRRERDEFVNRALAAAGLPVIRQRAARQYDPRALQEAVLAAIASPSTQQAGPPPVGVPAQAAVPPTEATAPLCPKCGVPMVPRVAKRGEHRGQAFLGCPNYPRCRETIQR